MVSKPGETFIHVCLYGLSSNFVSSVHILFLYTCRRNQLTFGSSLSIFCSFSFFLFSRFLFLSQICLTYVKCSLMVLIIFLDHNLYPCHCLLQLNYLRGCYCNRSGEGWFGASEQNCSWCRLNN